MPNKIRLNKITQIANNEEAAVALFNANVDKVNKAIEDSVSRSGAVPTEMQADLDMSGKRIINLGEPKGDLDPVRYKDIKNIAPSVKAAEAAAEKAAAYANEAVKAADYSASQKDEAKDMAELSEAWAIADDFDDRLEGESSSKAYSNLAMAIANAPEDTPVNMSELQSTVILKGDSATLKIANVSTLPAGHEAYIRNIGTERDAVFEIGLPRAENDHYAQGNLGDIRSTTAWTLPKGCAWCDGSWKNQAEYPDMYEAVRTKQVAVQTAAWYETHLKNYGCCAYFVLDEAGKRFRIPALKGNIMIGTASGVSPFEYGRYQPAGLPNIAGNLNGLLAIDSTADGAFSLGEEYAGSHGGGSFRNRVKASFSAARSNPIYGRSNTVQPEALLLNYYVVLSESRKSIYCPKPSVSTFTDLPTSGNILGDTRVALDTSIMYVWSQTAKGSYTWSSLGSAAPSTGATLAEWGSISGDITAQADLQEALSKKVEDSSEQTSSISLGSNSKAYGSEQTVVGADATGGIDGSYATAVGFAAKAYGEQSSALGATSQASAKGAIQIGHGINEEENTLKVGFWVENPVAFNNVTDPNYVLLTSDGKIPVERLPDDISGGASTLEDIAVAGEGILLTSPVVQNFVANGDIKGSPTISTEGLLTGLSSSNYLQISENSAKGYSDGRFFREKCNWSISCKFKTPSTVSKARIFRAGSSVTDSNNYLWCSYSEDGSSGTVSAFVYAGGNYTLSGTTVLELDTWYSVRLSRNITDNTYTLELAKDGEDWHTEAYISSSSSLGYNYYYYLYISQVSSSYTALEYDLRGLSVQNDYANVNWTAYVYDDTKTEISSPALINYGTDSLKRSVVIKSPDGTDRISAEAGAVLKAAGYSVQIGYDTSASNYGTAVGYSASAFDLATAIGRASASEYRAICIGSGGTSDTKASASGQEAIGIGNSVSAGGAQSVAVGAAAKSSGYRASSLGYAAQATASNAIQIGKGTNSTANTFSVGLSDSLNVQLLDATGKIPVERLPDGISGGSADLTGYLKNITNTDLASLVVAPEDATVVQSGAVSQVAFGTNSITLSGSGATAFGGYTKAQGNKATALGFGAKATAVSAIQIGNGTNAAANTMSVALSDSLNVQLLDSSGKIPGERMSLQGTTAPTASTVGSIGQFYVDTATSTGYMCVGVSGSTYTWKQITV